MSALAPTDRPTRRALSGATVLLALLTLVGCGPEDPFEAPHRAVTGARAALVKAGTATVRTEARFRDNTGVNEAHQVATTRVRYGDPTTSDTTFDVFAVTTPRAPGPLGGAAFVTRTVDLRKVVVGDTRYHRSDRLRTPRDRPWVALPAGHYQVYGSPLANPDYPVLDPDWYLTLLEGVSDSAALAGQDERDRKLDGVEARRYAIQCVPGAEDCARAALDPALTRMFPGEAMLSLSVWVDHEGRPRKLDARLDLRTAPPAGGPPLSYVLTAKMTFGRFGEPVQVTAPSAAESAPGPVAVTVPPGA